VRFVKRLRHTPSELRGAPVVVVRGARTGVEVPLPADVAVLEALGPTANLARARLGKRFEI
jgi:hypothetical protein